MVFWTCSVLSVDINATATGSVGGKGNMSHVEGDMSYVEGDMCRVPLKIMKANEYHKRVHATYAHVHVHVHVLCTMCGHNHVTTTHT